MPETPDDVMARVGEAIGLTHSGDSKAAGALLQALWVEVGADGDPFHRCAIAHALADVQDDDHDELRWELLALEAADSLTDARVAAGGVELSVRGFLPSLHLNVADVHRRLGHRTNALLHVTAARAALDALPADDYRTMIEDALNRTESMLPPGEQGDARLVPSSWPASASSTERSD